MQCSVYKTLQKICSSHSFGLSEKQGANLSKNCKQVKSCYILLVHRFTSFLLSKLCYTFGYIKVYQNIFLTSQLFQADLKGFFSSLGIYSEGFWMRADFQMRFDGGRKYIQFGK